MVYSGDCVLWFIVEMCLVVYSGDCVLWFIVEMCLVVYSGDCVLWFIVEIVSCGSSPSSSDFHQSLILQITSVPTSTSPVPHLSCGSTCIPVSSLHHNPITQQARFTTRFTR